MRRTAGLALAFLLGASSLSCKMYLPFRFQLTPRLAGEAAGLRGTAPGPVALRWEPADFPTRVDVIPTGVAISTRVRDFLGTAVGVEEGAGRIVTIRVIEARTSFEYGGK